MRNPFICREAGYPVGTTPCVDGQNDNCASGQGVQAGHGGPEDSVCMGHFFNGGYTAGESTWRNLDIKLSDKDASFKCSMLIAGGSQIQNDSKGMVKFKGEGDQGQSSVLSPVDSLSVSLEKGGNFFGLDEVIQ